jgi:hypothetical protein
MAGTALSAQMLAEMQDAGSISRESVRAFINFSGMKVPDDQIVPLQVSLERALGGISRIRDRSVPHSLEPAVIFRVRR